MFADILLKPGGTILQKFRAENKYRNVLSRGYYHIISSGRILRKFVLRVSSKGGRKFVAHFYNTVCNHTLNFRAGKNVRKYPCDIGRYDDRTRRRLIQPLIL